MDRKVSAKLATAKTAEEILDIGGRYRLLASGKVDLSGSKIKLSYEGVDLSVFNFEATDLKGSQFLNCPAEGVAFKRCNLDKVRFEARGSKVSMRKVVFDSCSFDSAYFGPKTLALEKASFKGSDLKKTKFMLGNLPSADFSGASLADVQMRSANLAGSRFRGAHLARVCLENATLGEADFEDATFFEMERWGEPDFSGAIIPDSLRYQYGIIKNPVDAINDVLRREVFDADENRKIKLLNERVMGFAQDAPEAMLIATEYEDIIDFDLFVRLMKLLKGNCA